MLNAFILIYKLNLMKKGNSKEKNILITGGTSGLGLELVKMFIENGMICDIRKRLRLIPVIDEQEKETFRKACYDWIDPFLK